MTPLMEFLQVLTETAEQECALESRISLEELPAKGGMYAELGVGFTDTTYYNKGAVKMIPVLFLCRNKSQKRCLEQLERICHYFQRLKQYPKGRTFFWMNTEIAKEPSRIGRDKNGVCYYSCILNNKIYLGKESEQNELV